MSNIPSCEPWSLLKSLILPRQSKSKLYSTGFISYYAKISGILHLAPLWHVYPTRVFLFMFLFFAFAMTTMLGYYFRAYRRRYWRTNYIYGTAARRARTNTDNGTHPQQAVSDTAQGVYWWCCCTMEVHVVESFEFAVNFANEVGKTPGSSTSTFIADLTLDSMTKGIDYIKVILQPHFNFSWHDTRWWNG